MQTTISLRATEGQKELIAEYAKMQGVSTSSFILDTVLNEIEDELDIRDMEQAMGEFKKNPKTYTLDEVKENLGL